MKNERKLKLLPYLKNQNQTSNGPIKEVRNQNQGLLLNWGTSQHCSGNQWSEDRKNTENEGDPQLSVAIIVEKLFEH
jgi:hypothetical protein